MEIALKLASFIHKDQKDKMGLPYITHPVYVQSLVKTKEEQIVALLHDSIEDCSIMDKDTLLQIERIVFGDEIADAIMVITHKPGIKYMDYIRKIKSNPLARKVKLADLTHNMDITRILNPTETDYARIEKYKKAKEELEMEWQYFETEIMGQIVRLNMEEKRMQSSFMGDEFKDVEFELPEEIGKWPPLTETEAFQTIKDLKSAMG